MLPLIQEEFGYFKEQRQNHAPQQAPFRQNSTDSLRNEGQFLPQSTQAVPSAPKEKKERLSVPPLNTLRLQPTRYKTKNAIMSIMSSGEVIIEFIKCKSKMNEDRVVDICRISNDGRRIIIYQPDPGRGLPIREQPSEHYPTGEDCTFTYDNLPSKHWKKYVYAARFVGLVKSKTPKVTYFSTLAKCHLMENMADFEMNFYSGAKLTKSPSEGIKVYNENGMVLSDQTSSAAKGFIEHSNECFAHCLSICNALELAQTGSNTCFPVTIGRRPAPQVHSAQRSDIGLRDTTNFAYSTPKSHQVIILIRLQRLQTVFPNLLQGSINFSISTISSMRGGDSFGNQILAAEQNVPIKRLAIPGVGTATEVR